VVADDITTTDTNNSTWIFSWKTCIWCTRCSLCSYDVPIIFTWHNM